jgi:hypothetical protein
MLSCAETRRLMDKHTPPGSAKLDVDAYVKEYEAVRRQSATHGEF